jgi:hypothetical protein
MINVLALPGVSLNSRNVPKLNTFVSFLKIATSLAWPKENMGEAIVILYKLPALTMVPVAGACIEYTVPLVTVLIEHVSVTAEVVVKAICGPYAVPAALVA